MFAALKLISSWAVATVPLAASIARPRTSSRREREPSSKRVTRLEMIESMAISLRSMSGISNEIVLQSNSIGVGIAFSLAPLVVHTDCVADVRAAQFRDLARDVGGRRARATRSGCWARSVQSSSLARL